MILPIVAYGDPVLRKRGKEIAKEEEEGIQELIENMFETMYNAHGVGLAAPQIGKSLRLFVIDGGPLLEEEEKDKEGFKKVFINPTILEEDGDEWEFEEGCLSIPSIRENVYRPEELTIHYFDENWKEHTETYDGMRARIIQHEYDHIDGILFTDLIAPLKKRLLKRRLENISKGKVESGYKMKFPK